MIEHRSSRRESVQNNDIAPGNYAWTKLGTLEGSVNFSFIESVEIFSRQERRFNRDGCSKWRKW